MKRIFKNYFYCFLDFDWEIYSKVELNQKNGEKNEGEKINVE